MGGSSRLLSYEPACLLARVVVVATMTMTMTAIIMMIVIIIIIRQTEVLHRDADESSSPEYPA